MTFYCHFIEPRWCKNTCGYVGNTAGSSNSIRFSNFCRKHNFKHVPSTPYRYTYSIKRLLVCVDWLGIVNSATTSENDILVPSWRKSSQAKYSDGAITQHICQGSIYTWKLSVGGDYWSLSGASVQMQTSFVVSHRQT